MTTDELVKHFKTQILESMQTNYPANTEMQCAFASGMLVVISAMRAKDGANLPLQLAVMHKAIREIGDEKGWGVAKNTGG